MNSNPPLALIASISANSGSKKDCKFSGSDGPGMKAKGRKFLTQNRIWGRKLQTIAAIGHASYDLFLKAWKPSVDIPKHMSSCTCSSPPYKSYICLYASVSKNPVCGHQFHTPWSSCIRKFACIGPCPRTSPVDEAEDSSTPSLTCASCLSQIFLIRK